MRSRRGFTLIELPAVRERKGGAFTLIELLVVIAIIALLVSILVPTLAGARAMARNVLCLTNLRGLGNVSLLYRHDFNGVVPGFYDDGGAGVRELSWPYVYAKYSGTRLNPDGVPVMSRDRAIFSCPQAVGEMVPESGNQQGSTYGIVFTGHSGGVSKNWHRAFSVRRPPPNDDRYYTSTIGFYRIDALDQQEATIYLTESVLTWDPEQYERGYVGGMISEHWYNPPRHRGTGHGRRCFNPVHGGRSNAVFVDGHGGSFDTARQDYVDEGDAECLWDWH